MALVRGLLVVLLFGAAVNFAAFIITGQVRHKARGLMILKWTLAAAFVFFAVLATQNLSGIP